MTVSQTVYKEEVLGRHVDIQFEVDGQEEMQFYSGKIWKMEVTLLDDRSKQYTHFVVFEDGDERWFDLAEYEAKGRLIWREEEEEEVEMEEAVEVEDEKAEEDPEESQPDGASNSVPEMVSSAAIPRRGKSEDGGHSESDIATSDPEEQDYLNPAADDTSSNTENADAAADIAASENPGQTSDETEPAVVPSSAAPLSRKSATSSVPYSNSSTSETEETDEKPAAVPSTNPNPVPSSAVARKAIDAKVVVELASSEEEEEDKKPAAVVSSASAPDVAPASSPLARQKPKENKRKAGPTSLFAAAAATAVAAASAVVNLVTPEKRPPSKKRKTEHRVRNKPEVVIELNNSSEEEEEEDPKLDSSASVPDMAASSPHSRHKPKKRKAPTAVAATSAVVNPYSLVTPEKRPSNKKPQAESRRARKPAGPPANVDNFFDFNSDEIQLNDLVYWLRHIHQGGKISETNVRRTMKQTRRLIAGEGITYHHWPPGTCFYRGVKVDLTHDFVAMHQQAKDFERRYGKDKGNGWLMQHPIKKLKLYKQEYAPFVRERKREFLAFLYTTKRSESPSSVVSGVEDIAKVIFTFAVRDKLENGR